MILFPLLDPVLEVRLEIEANRQNALFKSALAIFSPATVNKSAILCARVPSFAKGRIEVPESRCGHSKY